MFLWQNVAELQTQQSELVVAIEQLDEAIASCGDSKLVPLVPGALPTLRDVNIQVLGCGWLLV